MYKLTTLYASKVTGSGEFDSLYDALCEGAEALCSVAGADCDEYEVRKDGLLLAFGLAEHLAKKEAV